jgi:hypothetical protein
MKLIHRWKQTSLANKLLIFVSAIVAFSAIFQAYMTYCQYNLMKESDIQATKQTERMIKSSERIADNSAKALDEAKKVNKDTAERAERAIKSSEAFSEAAKLQVVTAKKSLESSIETFRTEQRAWVVCKSMKFKKDLKADEINPFQIIFTNTGATPALHVRIKVTSRTETKNIPDISNRNTLEEDVFIGPGKEIEFTTNTQPLKLSQETIDGLNLKTIVFTVFVKVTYQDIFKNDHTTEFCAFYSPETKPDFRICDSGNAID